MMHKFDGLYSSIDDSPVKPECPDCEATDADLEKLPQTFRYGRGEGAVDLTCQISVYKCRRCGARWTDGASEDARQEAVCRHLGRLTPAEVKAVRDLYGLSQADFSRVTGLGEASLSRWETGAQVQNAACDRLLRLIKEDPRNFDRLLSLVGGDVVSQ